MIDAALALCGGAVIVLAVFVLALFTFTGTWQSLAPWWRDIHTPPREGMPDEAHWLWDDTEGFQSWVGVNTPVGAQPPPWRGEGIQRIPHSPTAGKSGKQG